MRDLRLEDKCDITVKNCHGVRRSLQEGGVSKRTKGGLEACEVARGDIEGPVIIAHEEVKHCEARATGDAFDELIDERGCCGIADGHGVERLEVVDKAQGSILLRNAEPARAV